MSNQDQSEACTGDGPPCTEAQLLALHVSTVCLVRALAEAGVLDRRLYHRELAQGRAWLERFDHAGHNVAAFDGLLEMLNAV